MGIYHRWFRWLTEVVLKDRKYVIVNMDETGVAHAETAKNGYQLQALDPEQRKKLSQATGCSDYTDMKTSLLGVICNDPAVQPHLPQFILPKFRGRQDPPKYLQKMYEEMGYPLVIQHGTTGWNDEQSMKDFLLALRSVIYTLDKEMWILLVLD